MVKTSVIGVGLNISMPAEFGELLDQPWTDLTKISKKAFDRNYLVSLMINHLLKNLEIFARLGARAFVQKWQQHDVCFEKEVCIITPHEKIFGISKGIDENGRLCLENKDGALQFFSSGEISLRF